MSKANTGQRCCAVDAFWNLVATDRPTVAPQEANGSHGITCAA
jgi:hypothetical protein